jgi:hypothetical protein
MLFKLQFQPYVFFNICTVDKKEEYTKYKNAAEVVLSVGILKEGSDEIMELHNLLHIINTKLKNSNKIARLHDVG